MTIRNYTTAAVVLFATLMGGPAGTGSASAADAVAGDVPAIDLPDEWLGDDIWFVAVADLRRLTPDDAAAAAASVLGLRVTNEYLRRLLDAIAQQQQAGVQQVMFIFGAHDGGGGSLGFGISFPEPTILQGFADAAEAAAVAKKRAAEAGADGLCGNGWPQPVGRWVLSRLGNTSFGASSPPRRKLLRAALAEAATAEFGVVLRPSGEAPAPRQPTSDAIIGADSDAMLARMHYATFALTFADTPVVEWMVTMPDAAAAAELLSAYHRDASARRLADEPSMPTGFPNIFTRDLFWRSQLLTLDPHQDGAQVKASASGDTIAADVVRRYESMRRMGVILRGILRYADGHGGRMPRRLADVATTKFADPRGDAAAGELDMAQYLQEHLQNPRTGAAFGYAYRVPAEPPAPVAEPSATPVLFEVKDGAIDLEGAVGYADGVVRPGGIRAAAVRQGIAVDGTAELREIAAVTAEAAARREAEAERQRANAARVAEDAMNAEADRLEAKAAAAVRAKRYGQAVQLYERHVAKFPKARRSAAVAERLRAMRASKSVQAALANEKAGAECRPWLTMASNYIRIDRPDKARPLLQRVIDRHPDTEWATEARERLDELDNPASPG